MILPINVSDDNEAQALRKAVSDDEHVLRFWLQEPEDCVRAIGHAPFTGEDFQLWLEAEDQEAWVLLVEGEPVAYGEVWVDSDGEDVELAHIVVNPSQRGRGLGKVLTEQLYWKAARYGFPWVYMRVVPGNQAALSCYHSVGFREFDAGTMGFPTDWVWLRRAGSGLKSTVEAPEAG